MKKKHNKNNPKLNTQTLETLIDAIDQNRHRFDLENLDKTMCLAKLEELGQIVLETRSEEPTSLREAKRTLDPISNQTKKLIQLLTELKSSRYGTLGYMEGNLTLCSSKEEQYLDDTIKQLSDLHCRTKDMLTPQDSLKLNLERRKKKQYFEAFYEVYLAITDDKTYELTKRVDYEGTEYYGTFYNFCKVLVELFGFDIKPRGIQEYADKQISHAKEVNKLIAAL